MVSLSPAVPPPASHPRLVASRVAAAAALLALIALGLAWELVLAPTGTGTLAIKVVPLLLPVAGVLRGRLYTYRWLSLLVWLYVAEGAVRATSEHGLGARLAAVELGLALALFTACAMQVRAQLAARRAEGSAR
jgi:uncharacterized membrane protein